MLRRQGNVVWVGRRVSEGERPLPPARRRPEHALDALLVWLAHDRPHRR